MKFDPTFLPYPSLRYPIYARGGMVAASSPQASAAGIETMRTGGNAVDAAIAAATTLTVVEPTANGIGSDAFALVWIERNRKLYGINGSGRAPMDISIDKVLSGDAVDGKMPTYGWTPVMVPGAPMTWAALNKRFGKLPLTRIMAPAIRYAEDGYPVSPNLARMWKRALDKYRVACTSEVFAPWYETFSPAGVAPAPGDIVRLPDHARTLAAIAETGAEAFYSGELADRIVADSAKYGGYFRKEDLSGYEVSWVDPISVNYRGYDICEIPPNGQGIVALMALNILKEFDFPEKESPDTYHKQWEAIKIAFADGLAHVTDPNRMKLDFHDLITPEYGALRAREIDDAAKTRTAQIPPKGGTVYLCTADSEGNMVSYIQSNYMGFGSGVVVRGTGISLQNRGHDFSLNPNDANRLEPGKKSYHTIIPGFILKEGSAIGPFGVMGGYMQPQGHLQVVMNLVDFDLNPQQALDAPRWQWMRGNRFLVENTFPNEIAKKLAARGHEVDVSLDNVNFGRGQIILRGKNGTLVGGTEGRTDSNIACF